jgi:hypothetical protein
MDISVGDFDNDGLNDIVLPVRTSLVIQLQNYLFRIRMVTLKKKFNQGESQLRIGLIMIWMVI